MKTVCIVILAGFAVLFLLSRGGFRRAAGFLHRLAGERNAFSERAYLRALQVLFCTAVLTLLFQMLRGKETVNALIRNAYGSGDYTEELELTVGDETKEIPVRVAERMLSAVERTQFLDAAEREVRARVPGDQDRQHVEQSLTLPKTLPGNPSTLSWETSSYQVMDWDGTIGEAVPESGKAVTLTCEITLDGALRSVSIPIRVYPEAEDEAAALVRKIRTQMEAENDPTSERVELPETVDGKQAVWRVHRGDSASILFAFGLVAALLVPFVVRKKEQEIKEREAEQMKLDYPHIIGHLSLFLGAGMSLRGALGRICAQYLRRRGRGTGRKPGYEALRCTVEEMANGVSEIRAYERFGSRCGTKEYRTLAVLMRQYLRGGGREVLDALHRKAEEAEEDRLRNARAFGEAAGTKLLLPMVLLLAVVMAVLVMPAFLSM